MIVNHLHNAGAPEPSFASLDETDRSRFGVGDIVRIRRPGRPDLRYELRRQRDYANREHLVWHLVDDGIRRN